MPQVLFMGEEPIYTLWELVDFCADVPDGELARRFAEVVGLYRTGRLGPWLKQQFMPGMRSRRVTLATLQERYAGCEPAWLEREAAAEEKRRALVKNDMCESTLTFDALCDSELDPVRDAVLLRDLLGDLLDIPEERLSALDREEPPVVPSAGARSKTGAQPAETPAVAGAGAAADTDRAQTPCSTSTADTAARRAQCAMFPWYVGDGLDTLDDWSHVACSGSELETVLRAIAQRRQADERADGGETVHVCNVEEEASFAFMGGRFPHTHFVGHGNPTLRLTDLALAQMGPGYRHDLSRVSGLSFGGTLTLSAPCTVELDADHLGGGVTLVRE